MNFRAKNIDACSVTWATDHAKDYIQTTLERAVNVTQDPRKAERLAKGECLCCFYINTGRIGGASMTTQPCGLCGEKMHFCNTSTDVICLKCSRDHELCKRCGADIKLRVRRVFDKTKGVKA